MLSHNTDLHLLRDTLKQLCHIVDSLIEQDRRIKDIEKKNVLRDSRISRLEEKLLEHQDSLDSLENQIPHLRHLVHKNEDLENQLAFYCPPD